MYAMMNELSMRQDLSDATTERDVQLLIEDFANEFHKLNVGGCVEGLIAVSNFYTSELAEGYGILQWLSSPDVEEKYKRKIRSIINRCNWIEAGQFPLSELKVDCGVSKESAIGCLAAYERNEEVVSFGTCALWRGAQIAGMYYTIDEETEAETEAEIQVKNYTPARFASIRENAQERLFKEISSGQDLWDRKEALFPHLKFCDSVKSQLLGDPERFHVVMVMKRLQRMDEYFASCGDVYDPKVLGLDARTESETVRNDPELKEYRKFQLADGSFAYFFDHISFSGKYCGRIHFLPDAPNGMCTIGYIGRHLRTKKFKGS